MKKALSSLLVLVMLLSLCACGKDDTQNIDPSTTPSQATTDNTEEPTDGTTEGTQAPTEEPTTTPTEEPTTKPTETPTTKPTETPTTKPTETPTTKPTTCSHNYKDATCTAPKTCSKCGATSGSALGHSYKDATCTMPKTCTKCGVTEGTATGHTEVIMPAVEATTTSTGTTEGKYCSVCNTILVHQTIIPKKTSPSENSTFTIKKNDVLKTYASLYDYNEYSIDYVDIDKKDTSDSKFQITVTIGAVMLLEPEDVDYVPNYIKGYWELKKDGETVKWNIFTISSVEELEYREVSFTCKDLEEGNYTLSFTSYI